MPADSLLVIKTGQFGPTFVIVAPRSEAAICEATDYMCPVLTYY